MVSLSQPGTERARALLGGTCLFLVLPIPFVIMRLWARRMKKMRLCFNDYAVIAGLVCAMGFNVNTMITSILGGYGQHIWNVTDSELVVSSKASIASTFIWPTANTFVKLSILHLYITIFRSRGLKYASYAIGGLTILYWLGTIITAIAICTPFKANWEEGVGHCGNKEEYYLSTAIINLLLDVMIVILPLPILWRLHMEWRRKLELSIIFSLGAGICGISIMRCYAIATLDDSDITYSEVMDTIASCLEPTLGVINACLPILAPVLGRFTNTPMFQWLKSVSTWLGSTHVITVIKGGSKTNSEKVPSPPPTSDRSRSGRRWLPRVGDLEAHEVFIDTQATTATLDSSRSHSVYSEHDPRVTE